MPANLRENLRDTLAQPPGADLPAIAAELLSLLGYRSERGLALPPLDGHDFLRQFPAPAPGARTERAFADAASSVQILFQLTDHEIAREIAAETQHSMFAADGSAPDAADGFDTGNARSFLFVAVELSGRDYPRGHYAAFTRELNKRFPAPTVALFRTADHRITLAFIHRRPNRHDPDRDVMGRVSLVREIDPANPHRAHLDLLAQLALPDRLRWIAGHGQPRNFDGLLDAWLDALDTEALNRRFYRELFAWFQHAVDTAQFPADPKRTLPAEEHVIRLITRLLFVWFIQEKGLVSGQLFVENRVAALLKDYDRDHGDSYYRAILQNLFFATLNTEIGQRRFSSQTREDHRNFSVYRYRDEIADPDRLLDLLAQTPFINGGLFDCLDSFDSAGQGGVRIDCFTDNPSHRAGLSLPNRLFFGDAGNPGLIDLFHRYKFTIEENTPVEREVALDPELLGQVFENLLAAVNPETRRTARQETGSYYTPRPVVDYMVDQALTGALAPMAFPDAPDAANPAPGPDAARLRCLLDYDDAFDDAESRFTPDEKARIVRAIAALKALDPAVGSGAFPMGILHKLTLALRRLDPGNDLWEQVQRDRAAQRANAAFDTADQAARDAELMAISHTFEQYRDSDYGRKLYLIQNSVYGVDIQPIAVQIAKLRFFISLAIEQQPNDDPAANYGIKPLPNLETRFVAADTLLALERPPQRTLGQTDAVTRLEREIAANRERHFHASARPDKLQCRRADTRLRRQLAKELRAAGFPAASAGQIAQWEPFDQNAPAAPWFDPEYMFGVANGFDLVIGNPPYINVENLPDDTRAYLFANYQTCVMRTDIYIAFLEKSLSILNDNGIMCFIIPAAFTVQQYATKMRQLLIRNHHIKELVDASSYRIFENAVVFNVVLSVAKSKNTEPTRIRLHISNADFDNLSGTEFAIDQNFFELLKDARFDTNPNVAAAISIKDKAWRNAIRFDQICLVAYGARLNHRSNNIGKSHYISNTPIGGGKPFCEGRNIERYSFSQDGWLDYTPGEHYNPMFPQLFENDKLMFINIVNDKLRFAYDDKGFYNSHTVVNCVRLDLLTGATHRTPVAALKTADLALTRRFDYKYLLAVLNSQFVNWYFRNFLSEASTSTPTMPSNCPSPKQPPRSNGPSSAWPTAFSRPKRLTPRPTPAKTRRKLTVWYMSCTA